MHVKGIRPSGCDAVKLHDWFLAAYKVIVPHLQGSHSVTSQKILNP